MKTTICKQYNFSAAHFLTGVDSTHPCSRMHGHNYIIEISVEGDVNSKTGFVIDFHDLDAIVKPFIAALDHRVLNDLIPNPTAELIAEWFLSRVEMASSCTCWETPKCYARVDR